MTGRPRPGDSKPGDSKPGDSRPGGTRPGGPKTGGPRRDRPQQDSPQPNSSRQDSPRDDRPRRVITAARRAAFDILVKLDSPQLHADDLLRGDQVSALAPVDRHFVTALVMGTLRWQRCLDLAIQSHLARPNARLETAVRIALRMGAFQLLYMDRIPAHAAIGESVEVVNQAGHRFAAKMVNAVLRKMVPRTDTTETTDRAVRASTGTSPTEPCPNQPYPSQPYPTHSDPTQAYPPWMLSRWRAHYGDDPARAISAYGQQPPVLAVRIPPDMDESREWNEHEITLGPGQILTAARTVLRGDVPSTEAFQTGRLRIQEEGSQLVAEIAAALLPGDTSALVVDLCAAPGGKTMTLADLLPAARIVACESSPSRLARMKERFDQQDQSRRIVCVEGDAAAVKFADRPELILADVPCSGTGTLGRNPEIRHRLTEADLAHHQQRQLLLLAAALHASGRYVVYSTCSLEPEENQHVVQAALEGQSAWKLLPMEGVLARLHAARRLTDLGRDFLSSCVLPGGAIQLIPGAIATDGFYVAVIERS